MKTACFLLGLTILFACEEAPETPAPKKDPHWTKEQSSEMNKELTVEEDIDIRLYVQQHKEYKARITGSGLRYIPLVTTEGRQARPGDDAHVSYIVSLLDGTQCYRTAADEVDIFRVDKSNIETGIQEGIKKMRIGEKSVLIIPSHLAHGLIGDMDKIPPLTPIVVEIELLDLK
ncbi:MAG TPA: FKBP-type peptidyl-prolyl cis-trans isomerase [Fluviicola sp.]|nr:FKBP-type peptidyl-prolyl cis-trans isomerase [Fluviicola sp.]